MAESVVDEKGIAKNDQWRERIAAQERSGLSVRRFCKEQGIAEHLLFIGASGCGTSSNRYRCASPWWSAARQRQAQWRSQRWSWC